MWQPETARAHPQMSVRAIPDAAQIAFLTEHTFKATKWGMREKVAMLATLTALLRRDHQRSSSRSTRSTSSLAGQSRSPMVTFRSRSSQRRTRFSEATAVLWVLAPKCLLMSP